jgi:membrane protein DedA with SNARE-associated domain
MHAIAAASSAAQFGVWAYLAVFALMVLSFAGIPAIGAAWWAGLVCWRARGTLNVVVVVLVGAEVGGLVGYGIGARWGRELLERPGRWQDRRQKVAAGRERIFAKCGWLAVFFLSTIVCGMLKMKHSQFVVWNFINAAVYVLAIGPAAYGAGKVAAGEQDWGSLGPLVAGLAIAAGGAVLAAQYYRNLRARRLLAGPAPSPPQG